MAPLTPSSELALRPLGRSGLFFPAIGVGTNRWGDRRIATARIAATLRAALEAGMGLLDTAELYQGGRSERLIGALTEPKALPVRVITKYAPYPNRLSTRTLRPALQASLDRLQRASVDLYLIHFPYTLLSIRSMMDAMAELQQSGLVSSVGVSNFTARQMHAAAERLDRHRIALAANEVHYSLLHRAPERNGVLAACRDLEVALLAYFPLGRGRLGAPPAAPARTPEPPSLLQRWLHSPPGEPHAQRVRATLQRIASVHERPIEQVALAWLLQQSDRVIVIPGATRPEHVLSNAQAATLQLTADELSALDLASRGER